MSKPVLVLYHDNCPDGFTAAWAVWKALGESAEYRAVNYGQLPPVADAVSRRVILVDFSYPRAQLDALANADGATVEVYDHHKTAETDLAGWTRGKVVFDMERSGAGIAWDEFHGEPATWIGLRPALVSYVEDRDLWRWALPNSREVNEYLFSWPRSFEVWDELASGWGGNTGSPTPALIAAIEAGASLLRAKRARVEKICENVRWVELAMTTVAEGGAARVCRTYRIPVVNAAWDLSEIGEYLCERFPEAPCGGYYFDRADKRQWGFRSRGDFDVSVLCKQYGGGGHKVAAGFTSEHGWWPPS